MKYVELKKYMKYTEYKLYETHKILTNHSNLSVMKKFMYLAVLAGVALVGCTKNERTTELIDSQKEISFTTPVLSTVTKAEPIKANTFPTTLSFNVFAWYSTDPFNGSNAESTLYMNDVAVSHTDRNDATTGDAGAWEPAQPYYWPKNGKLTFDAYYPAAVNATPDQAKGIQVASFTATTDNGTQVDFLYSERVYDKVSSIENTNNTYDGVDIPFKHALSVVAIKVKALDDPAAGAIRVKEVKLHQISNEGKFDENITVNNPYTASPKWTVGSGAKVDYTAKTAVDYASSQVLTTSPEAFGEDMIVLPQTFRGTSVDSPNATIEVEYYINNPDDKPHLQKYTFDLRSDYSDDSSRPVTAWKMGNRYTYTLTFTVDAIYFAPSITVWDKVDITVPQI